MTKKKKPLSDNVVIDLWKKHNKDKKTHRETLSPIQMYEAETGKHAIWNGKITKQYQEWANKKYGKLH